MTHAGRHADALHAAQRMSEDHPERACQLAQARASLLAADGCIEEALSVVTEVVAAGGWWSGHQLADPDLDALRSHPGFDEAAATMRERDLASRRAATRATATVRVIRPQERITRAVVVVLHMHGVTAEQTAKVWAPVAEDGVLLVIAESTLRSGDDRPCWDDAVLAARDVCHAVACGRLESNAPLILAGGSQGTQWAARLRSTPPSRAEDFSPWSEHPRCGRWSLYSPPVAADCAHTWLAAGQTSSPFLASKTCTGACSARESHLTSGWLRECRTSIHPIGPRLHATRCSTSSDHQRDARSG